MMRILIVEDESRLGEALAQIMKESRYQADVVQDGETGLEYARSGYYDLMILDVMLPRLSGFEVARQLRKEGSTLPILMLTARDEIADKVQGLDRGADDYMTKPFSTEELLARVRALSRRQGEVVLEELCYDDLVLNVSTYTLSRLGKSVRLGFKEFEVLRLLMANPRMVLSKEDIILKVWGSDSDAEDNNVEAYISFLRKKFFFLDSRVTIGTIRKVGYKLEVPEID